MIFEKKKIIKKALFGIFVFAISATSFSIPCFANSQFSVSPMYQFITLTPGEKYVGNFEIVNPASSQFDFNYKLRVEPFSAADDTNEISLVSSNGDYNRIVDWIELTEIEGTVAPNSSKEVRFTINVPEDSPAGGQYATIVISSGENRVDNSSVDLREVYEAAHLIYADVVGETIQKGAISNINVPSFLFSGNISGDVSFVNEGNVHSRAYQTLQVTPLFSQEGVFTNEEEPKVTLILPGNSASSSVSWNDTPSLGVFHVIYSVEYEGVTKNVDKYVIVCPLWLLFLIIFALALLAFRILSTKKKEKN